MQLTGVWRCRFDWFWFWLFFFLNVKLVRILEQERATESFLFFMIKTKPEDRGAVRLCCQQRWKQADTHCDTYGSKKVEQHSIPSWDHENLQNGFIWWSCLCTVVLNLHCTACAWHDAPCAEKLQCRLRSLSKICQLAHAIHRIQWFNYNIIRCLISSNRHFIQPTHRCHHSKTRLKV